MQYRHIIKKNSDARCQQERAYINVLKTLNIDKTYNIETHIDALTPYEIGNYMFKFKRADGQFIWNGELISREKLYNIINNDYFVYEIRVEQVENIYKPITIAKIEGE